MHGRGSFVSWRADDMPDPLRDKQIRTLFDEIISHGAGDVEERLSKLCADEALCSEVRELLYADGRDGEFLQAAALEVSANEIISELSAFDVDPVIGKFVGQYLIVKTLGHGGMGTVYLAERADGEYRKLVAIKILRAGSLTKTSLQRFHNERQILANLEHPNIARLIDGGSTDTGLPYFVMEYVNGSPVDRYCDEHDLDLDRRLKIFGEICNAVEFAHSHSVIHRDIKPSNILVGRDGVPKLLDFGIAKLEVGNSLTASTATALRVMTPEYASPEQMRGMRVTAASDIYSLGVLLYELLTRRRPYDINRTSPYDVVQAICEEQPIPPSRAVPGLLNADRRNRNAEFDPPEDAGKIGEQDRLSPSASRILHSEDLDNIILKALRKEPTRRYASVREFAEDLARYQAGRPVFARQESVIYRGRRFITQHQAALTLTVGIALVFSLIGFGASYLGSGPQATPTLNERLLDRRLGGTDNPDARDLYIQGRVLWEQRSSSMVRALELFQQAIDRDPQFSLAYSGVSNCYFLLGVWNSVPPHIAFPKAKEASLRAIELAPESSEAHLSLAMVHWLYEYDWRSAEREFRTAIELNPNYARASHWHGLFLAEMGRFEDAIAAERRAVEMEPESVPINADLARVYYYARRYDESLAQYRKVMAMDPNSNAFYEEFRELYQTIGNMEDWARLAEASGELRSEVLRKAFDEGGYDTFVRKWLEIISDQYGGHAPGGLHYIEAERHAYVGNYDQAIECLTKALEGREHRMAQLRVNPRFDVLRDDPRFVDLVRRMNFPE